MKLWVGVVLALVVGLAACGGTTGAATPSPSPSVATLTGAKLVVANQSWLAGQRIIFTGSGFDGQQTTKAEVIQAGKDYPLGTVGVGSDGSFAAVLVLPKTLSSEAATLRVCSYASGAKTAVGCVSQPISLRSA